MPVNEDATEWRRSKGSIGKFKRGQKKVNALVRANMNQMIWRFQTLSKIESGGGAQQLPLLQAGGAGTVINYPLVLYDLYALQNVYNGSTFNPIVGYKLAGISETAGANVYFTDLIGQLPDGTSTGSPDYWQPESLSAANTFTQQSPLRSILTNWVQMKLLMYGTLTRATRFRVELIKLKKDYLHPDWWPTGIEAEPIGPGASEGNVITQRNAFWQYMLMPYISTPLNVQDPMLHKQYKSVATICDVLVEPKLTTEPKTDATDWPTDSTGTAVPHMRQHDFFMKMDKVCKYDWNEGSVVGGGLTTYVPWQQSATQTVKTTVDPKQRVYLMIRALAPSVGATFNVSNQPSFDILLRKKVTNIQ